MAEENNAPTAKTGEGATDSMLAFLDKVGGEIDVLDDRDAPETASTKSPSSGGKLPSRSDDLGGAPPATDADGDEDPPEGDTKAAEEGAGDDEPGKDGEEADAGADADATEELDAAELAAFFGLDENDLVVQEDGTVGFKYKVGDESGAATLKDLVRGYQLERNLNRKSEQLSEEVKQTQQVRNQFAQALDAQQDLLEGLKAQVTNKYAETNWAELEEEDPGRAALLRQKMAEDFQGIEAQLAENQQKREYAARVAMQEQQDQLAKFFEQEQERFTSKVPEWGKDETRAKMATEFRGYLSELGFSDAEMAALRDHRLMLMVKDAVEFRKLNAKVVDAKKKVVKVPRRIRAGGRTPQKTVDAKRKQSAVSRLRQTGSDRDAAAAFLAMDIV